ncbi:glycosyltransferase family 39 protein [candidate division KSB1 bacterium]|nr:glycosyltransferase family 39 protein [candidate division KSB1 bacterium]
MVHDKIYLQFDALSKSRQFGSYLPVVVAIIGLFLPYDYAVAFLLIALLTIYLLLRYPFTHGLFYKLVWIAFILRMALVVLNHIYPIMPEQTDHLLYNGVARTIMDNYSRNLPTFYQLDHYSMNAKSYSLFLSWIYSIFGPNYLLPKIINSFFGVLSGILVYKIVNQVIEDEKVALFSGALTLFTPSIIAFTSYILRDSIIMYLSLLMVYFFCLWFKKKTAMRNFVFWLASFLLVSIARIQNFALYLMLFLFFFAILLLKSPRFRVSKWLLLALLIAGVSVFYLTHRDFVFSIAMYPLRAQPLRAEGGSAYLVGLEYNNFFDLIKYLPIRFIYFTFGPFLWNASGAFQYLSAMEGFFNLAAFIFTVKYIIAKRYGPYVDLEFFLLLFCLFGLFSNALVDSNFGTAVRHRMNYVIFLFIFGAAYLRDLRLKLI